MGSATVLERVRSIPQLRLEASSEAGTSVVFHGTTIARIDEARQTAEISVAVAGVGATFAGQDGVERGPLGVTLGLGSANGVQTAVGLIREVRDQGLYG